LLFAPEGFVRVPLPELELSRWGNAFASEASEAAFRAWHYRRNHTTNLLVIATSFVAWVLVSAMFIALEPTRVAVTGPPLGGVLATLVAMFFVERAAVAPMRRLAALNFVHSAFVGWALIFIGNHVLHTSASTMAALVMVSLVQFQFTANFTTLPVLGFSVGSYFAAECVWLVQSAAERRVSPTLAWAECALLIVCFGFGLFTAMFTRATARRWFRQEQVIDAQQRTIDAERSRIEQLLKNEVQYQVAARSRELGAALAGGQPVEARQPEVGDRIDGRYQVLAPLGAGAMGAVFEVERLSDSARFALKAVKGFVSGAAGARFAREAEIGARLRHPRLVSIIDVGLSTGTPYLVMELVAGQSLDSHQSQFGDATWALEVLGQMAEGLAVLHDAGVVHRDLKPANVLVTSGAAGLEVRISDFGISRFAEHLEALAATLPSTPVPPELTATGALMGTPQYMSPEARHGAQAIGASADLFAFGLIAYELLTGARAFEAPPVMLAMAHQPVKAPALAAPSVSPSLRAVLERCLSEDPALRPSAREVVAQFASA
jgi:hypothetical protein